MAFAGEDLGERLARNTRDRIAHRALGDARDVITALRRSYKR